MERPQRPASHHRVSTFARIFTFLAASAVALPALQSRATGADDLPTLNQIQGRFEAVHEQVAPAVVAVQCRGVKAGGGFYGTGVVISPDGLVLTSCTVVPPNTPLVK